jgi:hypothetical protein
MYRCISITVIAVLLAASITHVMPECCSAGMDDKGCHKVAAHHDCPEMHDHEMEPDDDASMHRISPSATCPMDCCCGERTLNKSLVAAAVTGTDAPSTNAVATVPQAFPRLYGFSSHTDRGPPSA